MLKSSCGLWDFLYVLDIDKSPIRALMCQQGLGFTMWRYCAYTLIDPDPPTELYFIPIQIVSGQPQMIRDRRQHQIVPGWYSVTRGPFELTPEFDCLLAGDASKAHQA